MVCFEIFEFEFFPFLFVMALFWLFAMAIDQNVSEYQVFDPSEAHLCGSAGVLEIANKPPDRLTGAAVVRPTDRPTGAAVLRGLLAISIEQRSAPFSAS